MRRVIVGIWKKSLDEVEKWLEMARNDDAYQVKIEDAEVVEEFTNWHPTPR